MNSATGWSCRLYEMNNILKKAEVVERCVSQVSDF